MGRDGHRVALIDASNWDDLVAALNDHNERWVRSMRGVSPACSWISSDPPAGRSTGTWSPSIRFSPGPRSVGQVQLRRPCGFTSPVNTPRDGITSSRSAWPQGDRSSPSAAGSPLPSPRSCTAYRGRIRMSMLQSAPSSGSPSPALRRNLADRPHPICVGSGPGTTPRRPMHT